MQGQLWDSTVLERWAVAIATPSLQAAHMGMAGRHHMGTEFIRQVLNESQRSGWPTPEYTPASSANNTQHTTHSTQHTAHHDYNRTCKAHYLIIVFFCDRHNLHVCRGLALDGAMSVIYTSTELDMLALIFIGSRQWRP